MASICQTGQSSVFEYDKVKSVTREYSLKGYASRYAAEQALGIYAPLTDPDYPTLVRKPLSVSQRDPTNENYYTAVVSWEEYLPPVVDREILSGSITLATQTIKHAWNRVGTYGNFAPDTGGLINVTLGADPDVAGVDVAFPVMSFQIQRLYPKGTFDLKYLASVMEYVSFPNNAPWRNFNIGEVRLSAIDGSNDDSDFDPITFTFEASPSFTNIVIPSAFGAITVPQKLGWQYLHVSYLSYYDEASGSTTSQPIGAYVDELTPGVDLNDII